MDFRNVFLGVSCKIDIYSTTATVVVTCGHIERVQEENTIHLKRVFTWKQEGIDHHILVFS